MRLILTLFLFLSFSTSFAQWTRVEQLPASDILNFYHKGNTLYASGKKVIYFSNDNGQTWDSTSAIPQSQFITNFTIYKDELYAGSYSIGVFKSVDGGATWQNITAGLPPFVSDFCEFQGQLFASTEEASVFKLNTARNGWAPFSNGLSNTSSIATVLGSNNNAMIAGTSANGIYDRITANSTTWEEGLLRGQLSPNEGSLDITTAHDTLVVAGRSSLLYISTNNGLNWNFSGNILLLANASVVNAKQAFLLAHTFVINGVGLVTSFVFAKKDALQQPFVPFSFVPNHFTWKLEVFGNKIWDASDHGLFFMSLSDLPGITPADEPQLQIPLPVHFTLFNAACEGNNVTLTWKTAQEQNSDHFNIERSIDGLRWTVIGNLSAAHNSTIETSYSFTDNNPVQNSFYRIAGVDLDGRTQYTSVVRSSSCTVADAFSLWPNPVSDKIFINIVTANASQAVINVFDSKGSLVKTQKATVLQGSNQLNVDMRSFASGVYLVSAEWNNGQMKKTVRVLKQ